MRKSIVFFVLILSSGLLRAQDSSGFQFTLNHLALSVKDVDRSASFYSLVLKLQEIENRAKLDGVRWFALNDGRELHLISIVKEPIVTNKALHLALSCPRFDDFVKKLIELKIPYYDWAGKSNTVNIRADGIKQIFFQDPDGYWIEVNSLNK